MGWPVMHADHLLSTGAGQRPFCGSKTPSSGLNATLRIISGKWKPLVLFFLRNGPKRYGELKRLIPGVSDKVLIQQLKDLEADRVLVRTDYKEVPPRVDYSLTPLGRSLAEATPSRRPAPVLILDSTNNNANR